MTKLLDDISTLTNIPDNILKKLVKVSNYSITHTIYEGIVSNKSEVSIDLGIGELEIYLAANQIRYRFIPSNELEKDIIKTIQNKVSPIAITLDDSLKTKIDKCYKELI